MKMKIDKTNLRILKRYKEKRRNSEIENYLTDAMYQMSSMSSFMPIEEMMLSIAESNYGALSDEFRRAYNEIMTGASFEDALEKMILRNNSRLLERSLSILVLGYQTGADISHALKEIADDAAQTFDLYRQRASGMTIEKYTMLLAGGIVVPLILGSMISLVHGLDLGSLSGFGLGLDIQTKELILSNAILGNHIYIALYAILSSVFVSYQENKLENALIYVLFLLPCSLILFNVAMRINLLAIF